MAIAASSTLFPHLNHTLFPKPPSLSHHCYQFHPHRFPFTVRATSALVLERVLSLSLSWIFLLGLQRIESWFVSFRLWVDSFRVNWALGSTSTVQYSWGCLHFGTRIRIVDAIIQLVLFLFRATSASHTMWERPCKCCIEDFFGMRGIL